MQDDAAVGDRVQEDPDDESDDSDFTEEALEDIMSDGELDDIEDQNPDELLEELREEPGTINSPTRYSCIASRQSMATCSPALNLSAHLFNTWPLHAHDTAVLVSHHGQYPACLHCSCCLV